MLKLVQVTLAILILALAAPAVAQESEPSADTLLDANFSECVSGLKAVEIFVRDNKPELNPKYFRSLYLWEAVAAGTKISIESVPPGSISEVKKCSQLSLSGADINFFMSHVYGFGPDNPEEELARCYSAMFIMSISMNNMLGIKMQKNLDILLDTKLA